MALSVTIFGPSHHWWKWKKSRANGRRVWFYRSQPFSFGATGFCIPGLHVVFTWE